MGPVRIAAAVACLAFANGSGVRADVAPVIDVYIENTAAIPAHMLQRAQVECGDIFGRAGLVVRWTIRGRGTRPPPAAALTVIIVDPSTPLRGRTGDPLGMAPEGDARHRGHIAYVFYDRVKEYARTPTERVVRFFDSGQILGAVMAHEIGHLLLPFNAAHGSVGVMRGIWNAQQFELAAYGHLDFTADEAAAIRESLRRRADAHLAGGSP